MRGLLGLSEGGSEWTPGILDLLFQSTSPRHALHILQKLPLRQHTEELRIDRK